MRSSSEPIDPPDWSWVMEGIMEVGGDLIFLKSVPISSILNALGMDEANVQILSASRSYEAVTQPIADPVNWMTIHPWMRVGYTEPWTFVISPSGFDPYVIDEIVCDVSLDTDVVLMQITPTIDSFKFFRNGSLMVQFDPGAPYERFGSEPDMFLSEMRESGLAAERPAGTEKYPSETPHSVVRVLEMVSRALDIRISREMAAGPLPTVQQQ
jgi:hypothetical protein